MSRHLRTAAAGLAVATTLAAGLVLVGAGNPTRDAVPAAEVRTSAAAPAVPRAVRIPRLGVDSTLDALATDPAGVLVPPETAERAGWFASGVLPGERGPAVIAGHVDSRATGPGVFFALGELRPGDDIEVERSDGLLRFRVLSVQTVGKDEFPTERVYGPTPVPELRLITCGGGFDERQRRYLDNVIVRAELVGGPR